MQSKKLSLIESIANTFVGFILSIGLQLAIYPVLDIEVTLSENLIITLSFMVLSVLRGYFLRRLFNKIRER